MINNPQIRVKVIADSINAYNGVRITTFEYEAPKFILSEVNTHRVFSRNAASSRAIPVMTILKQVWKNPFTPVYWGANQSGMQAKTQLEGIKLAATKLFWNLSSKGACFFSWALIKAGLHKQLTNRVVEPWVIVKGVISATETDNWYDLRMHSDAQPEIQDLAMKMHTAQVNSKPKILYQGQWHVPYVESVEDGTGAYASQSFFDEDGNQIDLETALKVSASCCAQVSYRKNDQSVQKAENIFDRLINSNPPHFSPVEHQAISMPVDRSVFFANFRGWKQYRKFIEEKKA